MIVDSFKKLIRSLPNDDEALDFLGKFPALYTDQSGATPLVGAVRSGRNSLVKKMLDIGFSVNDRTMLASPLGAAISFENEDDGEIILKTLIECADIHPIEHPREYCGELNEPMLHAALRRRRVGMARVLIEYGASLDCVDSDGVTARELANKLNINLEDSM